MIDPVHLILAGLAMDIAGACLITLPDVPRLRDYLRSFRIRRAVEQMELGGVQPHQTGYDELSEKLEDLYGVEISTNIAGLRVGFQNLQITAR